MFGRNEWVYPTLFGEHSYYKPPATYWLLLGSWKIFGFSFGAAILPFAFLLLLSAVLLSQVAGSAWAGLFLVGNIASLMFGFTTQMEVLLVFCVVGLAWTLQRERWGLAWSLVGSAALVKSPSYSILLGSSLVIHTVLTHGWRTLCRRRIILGALWALIVGLSWYAWVAATDHDAFVSQFIQREHLSKLQGNGISFFQMTREFLLLCAPIFFLLLPAGIRPNRLALILSAPLILFLMWTPYRMDAYLYPLLPLLIWQCLPHLSRFPRLLRAQGIFISVAILGLLPLLYSSRIIATTALVGLAVFAVLYAWASHPLKVRELAWCSVILVFIVRVSAQHLGEQDVAGLRTLSQERHATHWLMYDASHDIWHEAGYLSTAIGKPIQRVFDVPSAVTAVKAGGSLIVDNFVAKDILPALQSKARVQLREWKRWKRGIYKIPLAEMLAFRQAPLNEWQEKNQKIFWIVSSAD